jgi:hypothetical protein
MNKYKKGVSPSEHTTTLAGIAVLFVILLSSAGLYVSSSGVQQQQQQYQETQQSATMTLAGINETLTTAPMHNAANNTSTNENATIANQPNATLVEFISNIEQIRGHLEQALINKESGNNTLAQAHVLHPIEEVYSNIQDQLANQNSTLNQTLSTALQNLSYSVTNAALPDVESQINHINMLLNDSVQTVAPNSASNNNSAFNASVVARLLNIAGDEYEEAVANGTVKAIVEYQDAQTFIHRAQSIFNSSENRLNQSSSSVAQEVQELNKFFSNLNSAINNKEDPTTIEATTINWIIHGLAEITGLSESQLAGEEAGTATSEEKNPVAIINHIKSLLNHNLLAAYRSQDYATAESVAIEAYLDNYENIEATIAQQDRALMGQIELMLREDLRQMVKDRVPVEQIEQQVALIDANLDRASQLLQ